MRFRSRSDRSDRPRRDRSRPQRLVQLTDLHLLADPAERHRGLDADATWRATLHAAWPACRRAALVVLTGDLAERGEASAYVRLGDTLRTLPTRLLAVAGNHDSAAVLARHLPSPGRRRRLAVSLGRWRLLLLDSSVAGTSAGRLDGRQLKWLRQQLVRPQDHHLVIVHHPPLQLGSAWIDAIGLRDGARLRRLLATAPRGHGVLFGHAHQAVDRRRGAVRYLGCPSTGRQFRPGTPLAEADTRTPGWREVTLYPNGRLVTRVQRIVTGSGAG